MTLPKALVLLANGTNRDHDVATALELAGAEPTIIPLNILRTQSINWNDYQMLVLPGGFSYADALGAGKLLALDLTTYFTDEAARFVESGKPVIGICNGFQALVKSGILPGRGQSGNPIQATLAHNAAGHFECRWVNLLPVSKKCLWTAGLTEMIECPVAHGEGRFMLADQSLVQELVSGDQIAFFYATPDRHSAGGQYPANPNGSILDIAGVCNAQGNVLGLMPHPENHIFPNQHPRWSRGITSGSGLALFINGVQHISQN